MEAVGHDLSTNRSRPGYNIHAKGLLRTGKMTRPKELNRSNGVKLISELKHHKLGIIHRGLLSLSRDEQTAPWGSQTISDRIKKTKTFTLLAHSEK